MKQCNHTHSAHKGFVINAAQVPWMRDEVPKPIAGKALFSVSICDRPACIEAAKRRIAADTNETAVWIPFTECPRHPQFIRREAQQ